MLDISLLPQSASHYYPFGDIHCAYIFRIHKYNYEFSRSTFEYCMHLYVALQKQFMKKNRGTNLLNSKHVHIIMIKSVFIKLFSKVLEDKVVLNIIKATSLF